MLTFASQYLVWLLKNDIYPKLNHIFHLITASLNLPPLWTLGFVALSWSLTRLFPILTFNSRAVHFFGLLFAVLAIVLMLWTAFTLRRHRTSFIPHRQASHLVTSGPFRFSRHPIYLADLILLAASGFIIGTAWSLVFTPLLALILRQLFIIPEEKMLHKIFPEEFQRWSSSVRRWF